MKQTAISVATFIIAITVLVVSIIAFNVASDARDDAQRALDLAEAKFEALAGMSYQDWLAVQNGEVVDVPLLEWDRENIICREVSPPQGDITIYCETR